MFDDGVVVAVVDRVHFVGVVVRWFAVGVEGEVVAFTPWCCS